MERKSNLYCVVILICLLQSVISNKSHHSHSNNRTEILHVFAKGLEIANCDIKPEDSELREKVTALAEEGKKLIFIKLDFVGHEHVPPDNYNGNIYKIKQWVRTYGRHGRSLLFLRPQFEHLSLTTLSFETAHINIRLIQSPSHCLTKHNISVIESNLRRLLVLDIKMNIEEDKEEEQEKVCNVYIKNENSYVAFRYTCCWHSHKIGNSHLECEEMPKDFWMEFLFTCVFLIKMLVILFCPLFVPESLYRKKYTESIYEHILSRPLELKIKKISTERGRLPKHNENGVAAVTMSQLKTIQDTSEWNKVNKMKKFYEAMKNAPLDKVLKVSLNKLDLVVRYEKLVPSNYVPVGIFQVFYSLFVKCNIRKTKSFYQCCKSSIFNLGIISKHTIKRKSESVNDNFEDMYSSMTEQDQPRIVKYPWHRCLRMSMRIMVLIAVFVPWILRVYFFYSYEESEAYDQRKAAEFHNLTLPIFSWSLTYTLTPTHPIFLTCYAVLVIDVIVFATVNPRFKKKLQSLMRRSLRDMRQVSKLGKIKGSIVLLLVPCEVCGIIGLVLSPLYFIFAVPVIIISLAFYCLPTVNVILRLVSHFFEYLTQCTGRCKREEILPFKKRCMFLSDFFHLESVPSKSKEPESGQSRVLQLFVLPMCILTVLTLVLLSMEIFIFYVEMILYTVIGIILNSDDMLKYLTLVFMLGVYARNCFKGVTDKYMDFNKIMNRLIVDMNRQKVEDVAESYFDEQKNTAFTIDMDEGDDEHTPDNVKLICKDGLLKWSFRKLILFLDQQDQPYVAEKFFFSTCFMDTVGTPGPLIPNVIKAVWKFICIFAFLMFVVLIVLAFGDEYKVSGTNQMIATLAGGLMPWVFENFLFRDRDPPELDIENLSFKSNFKAKIENFVQAWDIHDIEMTECIPIDDSIIDQSSVTARLVDSASSAVISTVDAASETPSLDTKMNDLKSDRISGHCIDLLVVEKPSKIVNV